LIPAEAYQPILVAIANGAAAEVMVRAQKPTLTAAGAARATGVCHASPASEAKSIAIVDFLIGHL
jgi:hypothetical protein